MISINCAGWRNQSRPGWIRAGQWAMKGVAMACTQVVKAGSPTQIEAATEIVKDARKKLYGLLAAD